MAKLYRYDATILEVLGKDSQRYLNARLSNDVKRLPVGGSILAAALTAQGRTEALFSVWKKSEESYLLAATSPERERILQVLKKFIVADRVSVSDLSDTWQLFHVFDQRDFARPKEAFELSFDREGLGLQLLTQIEPIKGPTEFLSKNAFDLIRLKAALPIFPDEINEDFIICESDLGGAISLNKGCYVGQEVLERIDSHGKAPRLLRLLKTDSGHPIQVGDAITSDGVQIGKVCTMAQENAADGQTSKSTYIFAYLKNETFRSQLSTGDSLLELVR